MIVAHCKKVYDFIVNNLIYVYLVYINFIRFYYY
jgi:hypothetical protein